MSSKIFYKMIYCAILVIFLVIIVLSCYCIVKLFYPEVCLGNFSEVFTSFIALSAFILTYMEYYSMKDSKKAQVLSEYNKRYSEDPNIIHVVKYLNSIETSGIVNNPIPMPSNYEVEMFMRFFEELELQIRCKRLEEKDVVNLFLYYAHMLYDEKNNNSMLYLLGITDIHENWKEYINIVKRFNKYK